MKSREYWAERMELLNRNLLQKADALLPDMGKAYQRAMDHIQKEIEVFYQRYADAEGLTFSQAKQRLSASERKAFAMTVEEYIEAAQKFGADPKWIRKLEAASINYRVTRLEALKLQMQQQVEILSAMRVSELTKTLAEIFTEAYYRTGYEIQKGLGVGTAFAPLDVKKIQNVLAKPWSPDGINFSERIWGKDRSQMIHALHTTFTDGIIRGDTPQQMIDSMKKSMNTSRSVAGRLVMTESAAFASLGTLDGYKRMGTKQFAFLSALDGSTCGKCGGMDGKVFDREDYQIGVTAPPLHPNCRCTTVPHYDDEFTAGEQRAARNEKGEVYYVPANMTYEDWKKAFVDGDTETLSNLKTVKKQTSEKVDFTIQEEGAIMQYISSKAYILNDCLRNGFALSADDQKIIEHLDSALQKMPFFRGDVQRSVDIATDEEIEEFLAEYPIGERIQRKEYLSTTKGAIYNSDARIQIYVQDSSKGRDISSFNNAEKEVLYERNSAFIVVDVVEENETYHILLREA